MSLDGEEETELRDLVTETLQNSGVLGKIKAQLRSNVYLAIEAGNETELKKKSRHSNPRLDKFAATSEGRLALQLVHEFLVFFGLDYSQMVFEPEALEGREVTSRDREKLIEHLGFAETLNPEAPLLSEVIKLSKVTVLKSETPTIYDDTSEQSEVSSISAAKTPEPVTKIGSDNNATFTLNSPKEPEQAQKSFLGDLPPLGGSTNRAPLNLAPLKKIPPVAKVEATKKEEPKTKPTVEVKPSMSTEQVDPQSQSSITEDIDEDLDEFLNSSISASEDLTKEETVAESDASLKADYIEKL